MQAIKSAKPRPMSEKYPYRFVSTDWKRSIVLWWKLPLIWRWFAFSREPTMYVNSPDDPFEVAHEFGHVVWLWEDGPIKGYFKYLTSKSYKRDIECRSQAYRIRAMVNAGGYNAPEQFKVWGELTSRPGAYGLPYTAEECEIRIAYYYRELMLHA